jgi:hypothetical protein
LGAYWSFYSIWFHKVIPNAVNYIIEPDSRNLYYGKRNLKLNNCKAFCFQRQIGFSNDFSSNIDTVSVDEFLEKHNIKQLSILHADIQGFEFEMLRTAHNSLLAKSIEYLFISTHSNEIHSQCISELRKYNYIINVDINMDESYSFDGLIVASVSDLTIYAVQKKGHE